MKIAVTYDNGEVFQHFGHTENFKIYTIENGAIVSTEILNNNGSGHGALAELLKNNHVTTLICGGIGGGAQNALMSADIKFYGGVQGNADQAVSDFLADKLQFNPNVQCHHHHHGQGEITCGTHICGGHH